MFLSCRHCSIGLLSKSIENGCHELRDKSLRLWQRLGRLKL